MLYGIKIYFLGITGLLYSTIIFSIFYNKTEVNLIELFNIPNKTILTPCENQQQHVFNTDTKKKVEKFISEIKEKIKDFEDNTFNIINKDKKFNFI